MEISGLNKIMDAIGDAFSIFDFSFFISGAATLGFVMLDMHYYGLGWMERGRHLSPCYLYLRTYVMVCRKISASENHRVCKA